AALGGDLDHELFGMAALPAVLARAWLGWCLAGQGDSDEAGRDAGGGIPLGRRRGPPLRPVVGAARAWAADFLDRYAPRAAAALERGLALTTVADFPLLYPLVAAPLGAAYARIERYAEGQALLEQAIDRAAEARWRAHHSLRLAWLADAHLHARHHDRALA